MKFQLPLNRKGITLIELLIAFVIGAIAIAGIYRIFISQTRAYTIQDQVVEVQQNIRGAMEIMVRDIRMVGFDYDNSTSLVPIGANPLVVAGNSITVEYEYYSIGPPLISEIHKEAYTLIGIDLQREHSVNGALISTETLLENVDALEFTCGIDGAIIDNTTQDGEVDRWIPCGDVVNGSDKVIAVRISLTARPEQINPQDDRFKMITPRTLTSTVTLRNIAMKRF